MGFGVVSFDRLSQRSTPSPELVEGDTHGKMIGVRMKKYGFHSVFSIVNGDKELEIDNLQSTNLP